MIPDSLLLAPTEAEGLQHLRNAVDRPHWVVVQHFAAIESRRYRRIRILGEPNFAESPDPAARLKAWTGEIASLLAPGGRVEIV